MNIDVIKFNNAVGYKLKNRRMTILKKNDDAFIIETKTLIVADGIEKADFIEQSNDRSIFQYRKHSKYCIWINQTSFSREAMECIFRFKNYIDLLES